MRRRLALVVTAVALSAGLLVAVAPGPAAAAPNTFVTMPDGVSIAVNVRMPKGYKAGKKYPAIFEMSGYDGGSAEGQTLVVDYNLPRGLPLLSADDSRQLTRMFEPQYVTIHASVRGSGCSSGEFDVFSWTSALDGKFIIDQWIPKQSWSNGDVAIMGHSYSGITGFMVAATQPKHLRAATVSGLIDDIYRGIVYPGGVSDYGFPLIWTGAYRPFDEVGGAIAPGLLRAQRPEDPPHRQETCAANQAGKSRTVTNDPLLQGLADTDNEWYRSRSLITYVSRINVPIHISGAYQDEQTGPRGPTHLWEQVSGVPKRLVITNGNHDVQNPCCGPAALVGDRKAWIDHWLGVKAHDDFGTLADRKRSVTVLFETHRDKAGKLVPNERIDAPTFPLPQTEWTDWYLHGTGGLNEAAPAAPEAGDMYAAGTMRQSWVYQAGGATGPPVTTTHLPDEVTYRSGPLTKPLLIVGPITSTLWLTSTAADTEMFVQLIDEAPDGSRTFLQRGMLKASHRAIDMAQSDWATAHLYRPWRPHTNPELVVPGTAYEYLVEIFPVGHIFRPGHRMLVNVTAPPVADSLYFYVSKRAPAVNTVLHDPAHPSRITLPVVPLADLTLGPELPCGAQEAVRCVPAQ